MLSLTANFAIAYSQISLSPDSTFGTNGMVNLNINYPIIMSYQLTQDKKFIASYEEGVDTPSGGYIRTNITKVNENGQAMVEYLSPPNFQIPVIYYNGNQYQATLPNSVDYFQKVIARYNPNYTLDTTFGNNGYIDQSLDYQLISSLQTGSTLFFSNSLGTLMKYTPSGQIDTSYGNGGTVICDTPNLAFYGNGSVQNNYYYNYPDPVLSVNGFKKINITTGNSDTSYGNSGTGIISNSPVYLQKLQLLPNGETINIYRTNNNSTQYYLSKTLANGQLDQSFGNNAGYISLPQQINNKTIDYSYTGNLALKDNNLLIAVPQDVTPSSLEEAFIIGYSLSTGLPITINNSGYLATNMSTGNTFPSNLPNLEVRDNSLYLIYGDKVTRYTVNNLTLQSVETIKKSINIGINNPFENELIIHTNDDISKVEIYSHNGSLVYNGNYKPLINTDYLTRGGYTIKFVLKNGETVIKKAIKK